MCVISLTHSLTHSLHPAGWSTTSQLLNRAKEGRKRTHTRRLAGGGSHPIPSGEELNRRMDYVQCTSILWHERALHLRSAGPSGAMCACLPACLMCVWHAHAVPDACRHRVCNHAVLVSAHCCVHVGNHAGSAARGDARSGADGARASDLHRTALMAERSCARHAMP